MLGTDGNPLRSADGKIVLADELYPVRQTWNLQEYGRYKYNASGCALTDIWSLDFGTPTPFFAGALYGVYPSYSEAFHYVMQYSTTEDDYIDWARVKKIKLPILLSWSDTSDLSPPNFRVTRSTNNSTIPSGTTIRDSWSLVSDFNQTWEGGQETVIEWDVNGIKPDSIEIAIMPTADTCATNGYNLIGLFDYPGPIQIVYNLATA